MSSISYPDPGGNFDDRAILRNAVLFSTPQRSFVAEQIRCAPVERMTFLGRAYLAVEAYSCKALSLEDFLGWVVVLRGWEPGTVDKSLWVLLDKKQLNEQAEKKLEDWAKGVTSDQLREAFHIPTDKELRGAGFAEEVVNRINTAVLAHVDSVRRAIDFRTRNQRRFVVGHNKIKHLLLAVPQEEENRILFPRYKGTKEDEHGRTSHRVQTAGISCESDNIRQVASEAIVGQAALNELAHPQPTDPVVYSQARGLREVVRAGDWLFAGAAVTAAPDPQVCGLRVRYGGPEQSKFTWASAASTSDMFTPPFGGPASQGGFGTALGERS